MLHLDTSATLAKVLTPSLGIPQQELTGLRSSLKRAVWEWLSERERGEHAWAMDPYNRRMVERVQESAKRIQKSGAQTVLWIGIGGSGLGPKVIQEAFETPTTMEFIVLDSIDPAVLEQYRSVLDWRKTFVVVVSKSGTTLETMSAFFLFLEELKKFQKKWNDRVLAITDPHEGFLREFCTEHDIETLPIPPEVGGRYCIFSPVGLLPLALLDGDIKKFVRGAKEMDTICQEASLEGNPAALLAATQFLLESKRGYLVRVIMPYSARLQSIGRWDQQLIAESLGKSELHNPIPLAAIGTQDQHSLLQQWMEGPRKSWHLFIREEEKPRITVPNAVPAAFKYIAGKSFGQILDAFYQGTSQALTSVRRPHATITITRLDEYHVGQLFFLLLTEVVFLGKLYRIDPYGQPGVEAGKKITKAILSRGMEQ